MGDGKPIIFLSHSCKDSEQDQPSADDPEALARWNRLEFARALRGRIEASLREGFDVWLDQRALHAGTAWRDGIHAGLAKCSGAVLLLSPEALDSQWVLKEATILTWRFFLGHPVKVVGVYLGGLGPRDLENRGFGPVGLDEIQGVVVDDPASADLDEVAGKIAAAFDGLKPLAEDKYLKTWIADLATHLELAKQQHVDNMFAALGLEGAPAWTDHEQRVGVIAREVLLRGEYEAEEVVSAVKNVHGVDLAKLQWLVSPAWVSADAAKNVPRIASKSEGRRIAALNGDDPDSGRTYVERAYCCQLKGWNVFAADDAGSPADFAKRLREHFGRKVRLDNPNQVKKLGPFFAIVGRGMAKQPVVENLLEEFPALTFLVMAGDPPASLVRDMQLELILPALEPDAELEARMFLNRLSDL